jgi:DNA-binding beta-propeller fold protein YncE
MNFDDGNFQAADGRIVGRTGMRRLRLWSILVLAPACALMGCGASSTAGITMTISPTAVSVIINTPQQFEAPVTGTTDTVVEWSVNNVAGGNSTVGTINAGGLYTAPAVIPSPVTVTITATAHANSGVTQSAVVTIISGVSINITPNSSVAPITIGTLEYITLTANVSNQGCNQTTNPNCLAVTWTLPQTTGYGTIVPNPTPPVGSPFSAIYTAPTTAPSPSAVTITATSVADTTVTATTTITIQTAGDPTLTFVSPNTVGLGSVFEDVYVTGTNFLATTKVYVNGILVDPSQVTDDSSSVIRARIAATTLALPPPSGILQITAAQQNGSPQVCSPDPTQCQIQVVNVRPTIVGPTPESIPQGSSAVLNFNVNGGFYGTATNPAVTASYGGPGPLGQRAAQISPSNPGRQASILIGGGTNGNDFTIPGQHPIGIQSAGDPTKFAEADLAVQPDYMDGFSILAVLGSPGAPVAPIAVGTDPADIAINQATGIAVVANHNSNDVTILSLAPGSSGANPTGHPVVLVQSLCTGVLGSASNTPTACPTTNPNGVAIDYIRNLALVANSGSDNVSAIDLNTMTVTWISPTLQDSPVAVGIDPDLGVVPPMGRAVVAMNTRGYATLINLSSGTPSLGGIVSISTGPASRIAVDTRMHWALATPGGAGSLGIVDMNRESVNTIVSVARDDTATVTVTTLASTQNNPQLPLALQVGDAVQIMGVSDDSFNGIYTVSSLGPGPNGFTYSQITTLPQTATIMTGGTVNYAEPAATVAVPLETTGIGINQQTDMAVLTDPEVGGTGSTATTFFSLLDQSLSPLSLVTGETPTYSGTPEAGTVAAAFNQITNTAIVVNNFLNTLSILDPTAPQRLNVPVATPNAGSVTGVGPIAVAVDPPTNMAVIVNQTDNTVSFASLGTTLLPLQITDTTPRAYLALSNLTSSPPADTVVISVRGMGFTSSSVVRLDGVNVPTTFVSNRLLNATVVLTTPVTAHRYVVDVIDQGGALLSNSSDFTVEEAIDLSNVCSAAPLPFGVSIDPLQNVAVVSLFGCNAVALIDLASGTGTSVTVGTNPLGVSVIPRLHVAVVANAASGNASVVDELQDAVTSTITTGSGSFGVATDQDTGEAAVANDQDNTVTVLNAATGSTNSISVGSKPESVAFDYTTHQIAVASTGSNSVGFANAAGSSLGSIPPVSVSVPTWIVYDPVGDQYFVASSTTNTVSIINATSGGQSSLRVGINPTTIAYNYLTSTLVTTNTLSRTMTVVDMVDQLVRSIVPLPPPPTAPGVTSGLSITGAAQFGIDIHPQTNIAVIADTANSRVLIVPLPR